MSHKLAYLCGSESWGGLEMNQFRNAKWMQERGHSVVIYCQEKSPIFEAATDFSIPVVAIEKHKRWYDFKAGKKLAKLLDSNAVSHLIVRDPRDMSISVIAKRNAKFKIHLSYFMEMQLGVTKRSFLHTIRFSYFDLWSCPLYWLAKQVETKTFFNKQKIRVITSGLDLNTLGKQVSDKLTARKKLNLPENLLIFGLIGRFDPLKGQVLVLEAVSKLPYKNIGVCFLGEPTKEAGSDYLELMQEICLKHKLEEKVFIRPFRKDIGTFFSAIDAFVMASKAETFGMVAIESMAFGIPVIASNAGGSPEILDFGKFGLLFESLNAESLAGQMNHFSTFPNQFLKENLRAEAQKYDHISVCEEVEKALSIAPSLEVKTT